MANDNAKLSENAVNAGALMGDVGTFSGNISGNIVGGSQNWLQNSGLASEGKYFNKFKQHSIVLCWYHNV